MACECGSELVEMVLQENFISGKFFGCRKCGKVFKMVEVNVKE